jgi:hypothetical protein
LPGKASKRRNGKSEKYKDERPIASRMGNDFNWIRAQPFVKRPPCKTRHRKQRGQENNYFGETKIHEPLISDLSFSSEDKSN